MRRHGIKYYERKFLMKIGCTLPFLILYGIIHHTLNFIFKFPIFLVLIGILIFFIIYDKKDISEESEENIETDELLLFEPSYARSVIRNMIPDFEREKFLMEISEIYENIQTAYTEFDYVTLEKNIDTNLYTTYKTELEKLKNSNQKKVIEDYKLNFIGIADAYMEEGSLIVSTKVNLFKKDYVLNIISQDVIEGCKDIREFSYDLFFKYNDSKWSLINVEYIKQEK